MKYFVALYDHQHLRLARLYPLDHQGVFRDDVGYSRYHKNWRDGNICVQLGADE